MKPTWLVERGVYGQRAVAFKAEVARQGMVCVEVDYRPGKRPPDDIVGCPALDDDACVVLWGTLPLMQQIHLRRAWVPGGWCNIENLDCATYYAHFASFLLNKDCSIVHGVDALQLQEQLFADFGRDDEVFVRPCQVHKLFAGRVAYKDDFRDAIAPSRYDPQSQVLVSTPKELGREWRFVIANDKPVASSQYRDHGAFRMESGCPEGVTQFVCNVLDEVHWRPDKLFMLDVCESNGVLRLLELNSFSCSSLYDCDLAAVVRAASRVAEDDWNAKRIAQQTIAPS